MTRSLRHYNSLTLRDGVLLEKLIVAHLLKNFNIFIKPEGTINIHTSKQVALSKFMHSHYFLRHMLILFYRLCPGRSSGLYYKFQRRNISKDQKPVLPIQTFVILYDFPNGLH
jgi:hypothetical protein